MNVELTDAGIAPREREWAIPPAVVARLGGDLNELEDLHRALDPHQHRRTAAGALDL